MEDGASGGTAADVVGALRGAAPDAFRGEGVVFAFLFGSQATGRMRPDSDVDVAVLLDDDVAPADYLAASLRLARRLERTAAVGPVEAVVVLNVAPLRLAGRVLRDRIVVFSADEPARVRYESETLRRFIDFELHAAPLARQRLASIAGRAG